MWLSYADQRCEPYSFDDTIAPVDEFDWGDLHWRAIAAPGNDLAALIVGDLERSGAVRRLDGFLVAA